MGLKNIVKGIVEEARVLTGEAVKDKNYSNQRSYSNSEAARAAFEQSKDKLFQVDRWSKLPGFTSTFELYNGQGERTPSEKPEVGDYIRILLPGPVPENWVRVTDIREEDNAAEFTVNPSRDPRENDEDIEHFFAKEASSTFRVELQGNTLQAYEIGKNEAINNDGKEAGERKLLNTLISEGGWMAFQELQWDTLTKYLVHEIEVEQ